MTEPMPSPAEDLDELFRQIAHRLAELRSDASRQSLLRHLRSLARWQREPLDYPDVSIPFPEQIGIAVAVCHPDCGGVELIVDGSTQECQHCGGHMFRTTVQEYHRG